MHTHGIEERPDAVEGERWFVRWACCGCGRLVGLEVPAGETGGLIDRTLWTDEARHRLERMPPYLEPLVRQSAEEYVRGQGARVVTFAVLLEAGQGGRVAWSAEAERRLEKVPAAVRPMARIELERTARERGEREVTVALMEEVKARYFGLASKQ